MRPNFVPVVLTLVVATCAVVLAAPAARAATTHGYVTMGDGVQLAYGLTLPDGKGPFPILLNYSGYSPDYDPSSVADGLGKTLLGRGIGLLGVNVRGTGCSGGVWSIFDPHWGPDGAAVVEWAARQAWSNGKVGMFGISFPGITQWMVAAQRPPHLVAIAPGSTALDVYRDVANPGGIPNVTFASFFLAAQNAEASQNLAASDPTCAANLAEHAPSTLQSNVVADQRAHPYADAFVEARRYDTALDRVQTPAFVNEQFNDEEVGARAANQFGRLDPQRTWIVFTNGNHSFPDVACPECQVQKERFFLHFLAGKDNGFERTPHVQVWQDTTTTLPPGATHITSQKTWQVVGDRWPLPTRTLTLTAHDDHLLDQRPAQATETPDSYRYPEPGASVATSTTSGAPDPYAAPLPADGSVAYTTQPLASDVVTFGSAGAHVWLASTADDTDLQATITEVRPDGQELYVARGWLRASHRALDSAASTPASPIQTHRAQDAAPLAPGHPTAVDIQVLPFSHAFRHGSRIRLRIDAPVGTSGFWGFDVIPAAATNTILHDAAHPSTLVLGVLPGERAAAPLPTCGTVLNEPCRADPGPLPAPGEALTPRLDPPPKLCTPRRRTLLIHLGGRGRLVRAVVRVASKRVQARIVGRNGVRITLRGLPAGRVSVRVIGILQSGARVRTTRRYRITCAS